MIPKSKRNYINFDTLKKQDLVKIAQKYLGYTQIDRAKSSSAYPVLINPQKKTKIGITRHDNGHYTFAYNGLNTGKNGSLIDLVAHEQNLDIRTVDGHNALVSWLSRINPAIVAAYESPIQVQVRNIPPKTPETQASGVLKHLKYFYAYASQNDQTISYYARRGISQEVLDSLDLKATHAAALLPLVQFNNNKYNYVTTISYHMDDRGKRWQRFKSGGYSRYSSYSVLIPGQKAFNPPQITPIKRIYITESPIDALSLLTLLYRKKILNIGECAVFATCGNLTNRLKQVLAHDIALFGPQEVCIGMDNDPKGQEMMHELFNLLWSKNCKIVVKTPLKKDFNDDLQFFIDSTKTLRKNNN